MSVLGITDTLRPSYEFYTRWLRLFEPDWELVKLSYPLKNSTELERCHGLLLTGGGDIHPAYYHREDALEITEGVDKERDEFELGVIETALDLRMPILGICRGMQVFNVSREGSMVPDVRQAGFSDHGKGKGTEDRVHSINIVPETFLYQISGNPSGTVNTNHHQAVDRIGSGLKAVARSNDGLIEALEWENSEAHPFLLLVQWHPERMTDVENPLAGGILKRFVLEVRQSLRILPTGT